MKSESQVQSEIMIEAAKYGIRLMRNNVGAGKFIDEETGNTSFVRFGLMNDSKEMNRRIKSSDLIGIMPVAYWYMGTNGKPNPAHYGQFIAVEVKKEGWKYTGTDREKAQLAFIDWVKSQGGVAGFCQSTVDFLKLIGKA